MIYLQQYDAENVYRFDPNTCEIEETNQSSKVKNGFVSFERCGLKKNDSITVPLSIFCIKDKVYLCVGRNRYDANEVDINEFALFIRTITIKHRGEVIFRCKQWSRDIDEFNMDDFFYFLKYSKKHHYENILNLCRL